MTLAPGAGWDRWLARAALLGLVACGVVAYFVQPDTVSWLPVCPFHQLTGLWCPGCGTTRMLHYLVHGELRMALRQNVMALVALPGVCYALSRELWPSLKIAWPAVSNGLTVSFASMLILFGVARNIPVSPFSWLAPALLFQPWVGRLF